MNQLDAGVKEARATVKANSKLLKRKMQFKRRKILRNATLQAVVQSHPPGTRIRSREFEAALHEGYATTQRILVEAINKGVILRHNLSVKTFSYSVPPIATSIPLSPISWRSTAPSEDYTEQTASVAPTLVVLPDQPDQRTVLIKATIDFGIQYPDDRNDLVKFVLWYTDNNLKESNS